MAEAEAGVDKKRHHPHHHHDRDRLSVAFALLACDVVLLRAAVTTACTPGRLPGGGLWRIGECTEGCCC